MNLMKYEQEEKTIKIKIVNKKKTIKIKIVNKEEDTTAAPVVVVDDLAFFASLPRDLFAICVGYATPNPWWSVFSDAILYLPYFGKLKFCLRVYRAYPNFIAGEDATYKHEYNSIIDLLNIGGFPMFHDMKHNEGIDYLGDLFHRGLTLATAAEKELKEFADEEGYWYEE